MTEPPGHRYEMKRLVSTVLGRAELLLDDEDLDAVQEEALKDVYRVSYELTALSEGMYEPQPEPRRHGDSLCLAGSEFFTAIAGERLSKAGYEVERVTTLEDAREAESRLVATDVLLEDGLGTPLLDDGVGLVSVHDDGGLPVTVVRAVVPPDSGYPERLAVDSVVGFDRLPHPEGDVVLVSEETLLSEGYEPFVEHRREGREVVVTSDTVEEPVETVGRSDPGSHYFDEVSFLARVVSAARR